jgi:hypothetical protein
MIDNITDSVCLVMVTACVNVNSWSEMNTLSVNYQNCSPPGVVYMELGTKLLLSPEFDLI